MEAHNKELLKDSAGALGIDLGESELELFDQYLSLLDKWSRKMNLTAIRGERERIIRLLIDSLQVVPLLDEGMRVMDIGSGAGLPGVPVKVVIPGVEMVLCESRSKRAAFLREVVRKLELDGISVFDARAEDWKGGSFNAVLVRGVGSMGGLAEACAPLLNEGGRLIAMKGPDAEKETKDHSGTMAGHGFQLKEIKTYCLPEREGELSIIVLQKTG